MIGFLFRRFRWMLVGAGVRWLARRGVGRSVDEAATEIEERLPPSVARAVNALPGDVMKAGGAAVVSARAAQRGAIVAQRGAVVAQRGAVVAHRGARAGGSLAARAARVGRSARDAAGAGADAVGLQAEADERDMRSDLQRYLHGGGLAGERAATEALLDLRRRDSDLPLPTIPDPVARGRRRFVPALSAPDVGRVQRSYRRPSKPWDRRSRDGSARKPPTESTPD